MTAPTKKGPLELAARSQLNRLELRLRGKDALALAAAAVVLAARADDLPDVPEFIDVECDHPDHLSPHQFRAEVEGVGRVNPLLLTKLLEELRQTMTVLTEGRGDGDPLAAFATALGFTPAGGPPVGHPERS